MIFIVFSLVAYKYRINWGIVRDTVINVRIIIIALISVTVSAEGYYGSYEMALYTEWLVMQSSVYHLLLMQGVSVIG